MAPVAHNIEGAQESKLQLVSRVSDRLIHTLDFDEALNTLIDGAIEILGVERASLMMLDAERKNLVIRVARGIDPEVVAITSIPLGQGIAGAVASSGEPLMIRDVRELEIWQSKAGGARRSDYQDFSALCVPLTLRDRVHGVMNFNHTIGLRPFNENDLETALLIANQAAIVLFCALLHREYLEKRAIDHELDLARSIQQRFLPRHLPEIPGFDFSAACLMCNRVGGDYYDFLTLDEDRLMVTVGDASGHGIGSALLMANARACLRTSLAGGATIEQALEQTNRLLVGDTSAEMFITVLLGVLSIRQRTFRYATAGCNPPVLRRGETILPLPRVGSNLPLGILSDLSFRAEERLELQPGDQLLLFTDGIWEATDATGVRFGDAGISQALLDADPGQPLPAQLLQRVAAYRAAPEAEDDCTLIAIRVLR